MKRPHPIPNLITGPGRVVERVAAFFLGALFDEEVARAERVDERPEDRPEGEVPRLARERAGADVRGAMDWTLAPKHHESR
jgi:hypothetical protein